MVIKIILALASLFSAFVLAVRLIVNRLDGHEKAIYILGLISQLAYFSMIVVQIINLFTDGIFREFSHAIGPEVDILIVGYILLLTFYHSSRSFSDYLYEFKLKVFKGG